jgi:acyl-CoA synthetase (AMP-forming)/AMP-acid ligase II
MADIMPPVRAVLDDRARRAPIQLAAWDMRRDERITFGRLAALVEEWHQRLPQVGIWPGDRVLMLLPNGLNFVIVYVALLAHGVTAVPANPAMPDSEVVRVIEKLAPVAAVVDDGRLLPVPTLQVASGRLAGPSGTPAAGDGRGRGNASDGGIILFTSGSTGAPKAVHLDAGRLLYTARAVATHHGLTVRDRGYSPLPLFHINAQVVGLLAHLLSGGTLLLDDRFHARDFSAVIDAGRATWVNAVPAILAILVQQPAVALPERIKFVRSASAPLPRPVLERFRDRFGPLVLETYGLTEAASQVAANPLAPERRRAGSVGRPVATRIQVVDPGGNVLGPGGVGEVRIGGPQVIDGYLDDGHGLSRSFRAGWFYTGDQGYVDDRGFLYLTGRTRDLINRGGQKIAPREVEEVLLRHPDVVQAAVVGIPHAVLGEEVAAHVVARPGAATSSLVPALQRLCAEQLGSYKRPAHIAVVAALPVSPTGKVQRWAVQQQLREAVGQN